MKTEHLNSRRLQCDHSYTLQGRLLSLQDGLFLEELRYRDANGNFKDGYVVGATITGAADWSRGHSYSYQYDEYGRLTAAQTVTAGYAIVPHPAWDIQGPDGHIEYDANGNLLRMNQGQTSSTYQYTQETNKLKSLLHDAPDRRSFGFEASELAHFHANIEPQIFGDWYAKGVEGGVTTDEKHSGTQSYQLGQNILLSKIQVILESKAYLCSGWLKMQGPNQEVGIQIKASLNGPVLTEQRVPFTEDRWQFFRCMLPDAGNVTELFVVTLQTRRAQPPLPVYIDDVTFGPLEQDVYEYNQNGWTTKNGKLDALHYDPHAALPVDIRSGNRSTHFRYGGRGQRVLKTTVDNEQNLLLGQRLYIHGANAYPLTEITSYGETIYIYGHGGVVAVCENGQPPSFLLKDHLGSTRVVVDQKNQPIAIFHYLPFGSLLPDNGNSPEAVKRFRYLYTGQEYDEEIGLYNYRARLYDSDLGRFLTPDPKRQFPSPYVYVNNNPLNFTDPTGEMFRLFRRGMKAPRAVPRGARGMKYGVFNNYKVQVAETVEDAQQLLSNKKNLAATGTSANRIPQIEYNSEAFQAAREPQALDSSKVITREQDPYRYDPEHPLKYSNLNGSSFGTGTSAISVDMSVPRAFGDEVLLLRLTKELPEMQFSELGQGFARYTVEELFEGGYVIATIPKGLIARRAAKGSALVRTAWGEWVPRHQSLRE